MLERSDISRVGQRWAIAPLVLAAVALPATPTLSVKLGHAKIRLGQSAKLTGTVSPAGPGTFVELQRRRGGRWRDVARAELRLSDRFNFTIRGRAEGKFSYRVRVGARTSRTVSLTVT